MLANWIIEDAYIERFIFCFMYTELYPFFIRFTIYIDVIKIVKH